MKLLIDVHGERVELGSIELRGQWVDFYALLALARTEQNDPDAYVTAATVSRVGPWRHKAAGSVGKEVSRHLATLAGNQLDSAIGFQGRTRMWRLELPPGALTFTPDRHTVQAWLDARSRSSEPTGEWMDLLRALIDAAVALQHGNAEATLDGLSPFAQTASSLEPALAAWTALLRGKASLQHDDEDDDLLSRLHDTWSNRVDAPGRAVGVRLRTYLVHRYRFEAPAATMASLGKLAADLELRGDIGSLAMLENVMGLLARRAGDPADGAARHLRAAALFGIGGDFPSLQAALFNLAICRREALQREGSPPDEGVLDLVEMCRLVCARFGVGDDSAQAEISGAQWAHEMGDATRARRYLADAERLLQRIESTYDQACFLEVRALIDHADPGSAADPLRDLRAAEALFTKVMDMDSVARVHRTLHAWSSADTEPPPQKRRAKRAL